MNRWKAIAYAISFTSGFFIAAAAAGQILRVRCPVSCGVTPGGHHTVPIDTEESEYACCINGACRVCDACPWYLEYWC